MNWEAIGAIGDILGAIAVIATLGYLAVQIKIAHTVGSDTNRQQRGAGVREISLALATHDELRRAWIKAEGSSSINEQIATQLRLNPDEANRLVYACNYMFWLHWAQWASLKTDDDLAELRHIIQVFYCSPPMNAVWERHPYVQLLDQKFVHFVNDALASECVLRRDAGASPNGKISSDV